MRPLRDKERVTEDVFERLGPARSQHCGSLAAYLDIDDGPKTLVNPWKFQ